MEERISNLEATVCTLSAELAALNQKILDFKYKVEQFDRIEKKMDSILELLGDKELSITMDKEKVAEAIISIIERQKF